MFVMAPFMCTSPSWREEGGRVGEGVGGGEGRREKVRGRCT